MRQFLYWILLILGIHICGHAQEYPLIAVANSSNVLQYQNAGKAEGPSVDILTMLLDEADLSADIAFMPWTRALKTATTRPNTIIMTIVRTPEREDNFHWIAKVSDTVKSFISLKENSTAVVSSFEQAKQKIVAVIRGSISETFLLEQEFSQDRNLFIVSNTNQAIQLLLNKKVDLVFCDPSVFYFYFAEKQLKSEEFIEVNTIEDTRKSGYIALSKGSDIAILNKLKAAQRIIEKNQKYHNLVKYRPLLPTTD